MDTGALYAAAVGLFFFALGTVQWLSPEVHRLSWMVSQTDAPETRATAQRGMNSVVRAMAVAGMYVAGLFLTLAWSPVFERLYSVFVRLVPGLGP
jgi:hypothetical protein